LNHRLLFISIISLLFFFQIGCSSKGERIYKKGLQFIYQGEVRLALTTFEKGLTEQPKNVKLLYGAGWAQMINGNSKRALTYFGRCIKFQDSYFGGYKGLGLILMQMGDFIKAEEYLKEALKRDGKNAALYANLGDIYRMQGKIKEAQDSYQKGITLSPKYADVGNGMIALYLDLKQVDEALSFSKKNFEKPYQQKLLKIRGYFLQGESYFSRAKIKTKKGDLKGAKEDLILSQQSLDKGKKGALPLRTPSYYALLEREIKEFGKNGQ